MANDDAERAAELAENEGIDILHSALYSALEAELSGLGWPGNSRRELNSAFVKLEILGGLIK